MFLLYLVKSIKYERRFLHAAFVSLSRHIAELHNKKEGKSMKRAAISKINSICFIVGLIIFLSLVIFVPTPTTELREPAEGYVSVAEEYIAAIEHYISTDGDILVPQNAEFVYDNETITIKDKTANAYLKCSFALNNTVPIYEWHYMKYNEKDIIFLIAIKLLVTLIIAELLSKILCKIYSKHYHKKLMKLDKCKYNATHGDSRDNKVPCYMCNKSDDCACLKCLYRGQCGACPTSDCVEAFEETLEDEKQSQYEEEEINDFFNSSDSEDTEITEDVSSEKNNT